MSYDPAPASPTTVHHSPVRSIPDAEFERRWNAWLARGIAHDGAIRRSVGMVGVVAAAVARGAVLLHALPGS
jgi:hypothetical protein